MMTVSELIAALQRMPQNARVIVRMPYDSDNYCDAAEVVEQPIRANVDGKGAHLDAPLGQAEEVAILINA